MKIERPQLVTQPRPDLDALRAELRDMATGGHRVSWAELRARVGSRSRCGNPERPPGMIHREASALGLVLRFRTIYKSGQRVDLELWAQTKSR